MRQTFNTWAKENVASFTTVDTSHELPLISTACEVHGERGVWVAAQESREVSRCGNYIFQSQVFLGAVEPVSNKSWSCSSSRQPTPPPSLFPRWQ